jgi:hypothetical protein
MNFPKFDQWNLIEKIDPETEKGLSIKTDGSIDPELKKLQGYLNLIFKDMPKLTGDKPLDEDGRYGKLTKSRIKDFQLLLKSGFGERASKKVPLDGKPTPEIFYTARDIVEMGIQKAFNLK